MASTLMLMMVGSTMMDRMMATAMRLLPGPPKRLRTKGTTTIMPKNPYTTDGMPASRSMAERMTRPVLFGASSARNTATMIPTKVENATERAVAKREATIIGKIPKISAVGCQVVPKIKSSTPILNMAGAPLKKMNTEMMATISTERDAQIRCV